MRQEKGFSKVPVSARPFSQGWNDVKADDGAFVLPGRSLRLMHDSALMSG